jgi:hypothetical protein
MYPIADLCEGGRARSSRRRRWSSAIAVLLTVPLLAMALDVAPASADLPAGTAGMCFAAYNYDFNTTVLGSGSTTGPCVNASLDLTIPATYLTTKFILTGQLSFQLILVEVRTIFSRTSTQAEASDPNCINLCSATGSRAQATANAVEMRLNGLLVLRIDGLRSNAFAGRTPDEGCSLTSSGTASTGGLTVLGVPLPLGSTPQTLAIPGVPNGSIATNYVEQKSTSTSKSVLAAPVVINLPNGTHTAIAASYASIACTGMQG